MAESWYRKVVQRTKSPELRLGEISMLLVSGRTEKHLYFWAEKLRRIKSRGQDTLGEKSSGVVVVQNNIKSNLDIQMTKRVKWIRLRRIWNPYGTCEIIRGCHNRDKGTAENERLRDPKFIFSYPKNERMIFLSGRNATQEKSRPCGWGDSQRTGVRTYPLFVLAEI